MNTPRTLYKGANVLVTGGLGFIGSNLAIALVELGAKVTIVDSLIPGHGGNMFNIEPIKDKVTVNISDMRDAHALRSHVEGKDFIFNLAAQVSHIDSMEDPMTDLEINCRSQLSLLETLRAHNPKAFIIYTGTRQVYGKPQYLPVDEKHPIDPVDVNGINTMAGEWYHSLYAKVYGMRAVTLRLTNTYGPRQKINNIKLGFVGTFIKRALQGETIQLFGDGSQKRDFNEVDDVVEALLLCGEHPELSGDFFNLGDTAHYSLKEFAELLQKHCRFKLETVPFPPERKRIDIGDYYATYEKFTKATGWTPKVDLPTGLERTVAYFQKNLSHYLS
jgi:nucleoside-diphosphate-sugar epimerase